MAAKKQTNIRSSEEQKDITMSDSQHPISDRFSKAIELRGGRYNEIGDLVTGEETARWIIIKGNTGFFQTLPSQTENEYYDSQDMLTSAANGNFEGWNQLQHFPKHPIKAPAGFSVQSPADITRGVSKLTFNAKTGQWYADKGRGLPELCPPYQQQYHNLVNVLLSGDDVALALPAYLGDEYIRKIVDTLKAGFGKAQDIARANKEEAKGRHEEWNAKKEMVNNDRGEEVGVNKTDKVLKVAVVGGGKLNLYQEPDGTKFMVHNGNTSQWEQAWDAKDEVLVSSWEVIAASSRLAVARSS